MDILHFLSYTFIHKYPQISYNFKISLREFYQIPSKTINCCLSNSKLDVSKTNIIPNFSAWTSISSIDFFEKKTHTHASQTRANAILWKRQSNKDARQNFLSSSVSSVPGWFFSLRDSDPEYDDIYFWMSPTWITLIFAAFNLGLGPISWSLLGDTLPEELKTSVVSMAVAFGWLISMMGTLTFDEMIISLGSTKVMWLSAAICWLIALFCAIVVKDNTGKSLIEIQDEFRIETNAGLEETWCSLLIQIPVFQPEFSIFKAWIKGDEPISCILLEQVLARWDLVSSKISRNCEDFFSLFFLLLLDLLDLYSIEKHFQILINNDHAILGKLLRKIDVISS